MSEASARKECEERQAISDEYSRLHYGDSEGPRRSYHWEVQDGEAVLVEE